MPSGYRVEVKFDTFRTYDGNDYLKIYDSFSNSSNSSVQLASLSGYQSTPRVYSSSGSSIWFSFYSDGSGTQKGFHANFTAITSSGTYNTVPYNRTAGNNIKEIKLKEQLHRTHLMIRLER